MKIRGWRDLPVSARIKTAGYAISIVSAVLLTIVSWHSAAREPWLAGCLLLGAATSISGVLLRWLSYEIEESEKLD